jgi:hypothetical protein
MAPADLGELLADPGTWAELSAILALVVTARRYPYPPLAALLAGACWILFLDLAPVFFGHAVSWNQRALITAATGALAIVIGFALEPRARGEIASWLYAAGLLAVCALMTISSTSTAAVALRLPIWAALLALAPVTGRRVFALFGALAMAYDLGRLAALALGGPALVAVAGAIALATASGAAAYAGVERRLGAWLRDALPETLVAFVTGARLED